MRRAAKADANQPEVVSALRSAGWQVWHTHTLGRGYPDLTCSKGGVNLLIEVKQPGEALTPDETNFHAAWTGPLVVVYSGQDAVNKAQDVLRGVES